MGLTICVVFFFFFQAEDGIRDIGVTGVQTCALPILLPSTTDRATPDHTPVRSGTASWACAAARQPKRRAAERALVLTGSVRVRDIDFSSHVVVRGALAAGGHRTLRRIANSGRP